MIGRKQNTNDDKNAKLFSRSSYFDRYKDKHDRHSSKKKQTGRKELKNDMQLYSKGHILRLLQRV